MSLAKWMSLGIGAACAVLVGGLMAFVRAFQPTSGLIELSIIAPACGFCVGLLIWVVNGRFTGELNRLASYAEGLGRSDRRTATYQSKMGLDELARAFEHSADQLRERIDQLVSQRRELEVRSRLAETERRHAESIVNALGDAVLVTDAFNEVILANESAARTLGFDREQVLHRPVDRVTDDGELIRLIKDTREIGRTPRPRKAEHKMDRDERVTTYELQLTCMEGVQSEAGAHQSHGVVTIMRDVTREREIADMKSDFVSNVSHELRTPLSSIKAYVEMLVDGEADDEQTRAEFYNIIQGETNRLSRLIDNILNISRIESGVVKVQREHVSLKGLIGEVIDVMQPQARAKQIEIVEQFSPVFFQVLADKDMLYQATLNLISNAIKYTMPKGTVTVGVDVSEIKGEVSVSVTDTGVGIPQEDQPHLFNKFYRVADHKNIAKGTGLGLNLVKHIIETVHGGSITVTSQADQGSTFKYTLPLAENQPARHGKEDDHDA